MRLVLAISVLLILGSCDAEKKLARILKNNPSLEKVEYQVDTLRVVDQIVNDNIVYKDSIVVREVRIVETPPTRYEVRYEYRTNRQRERTIRDSLNAIVKATRIEAKEAVKLAKEGRKVHKSDNRKEKQANRWGGAIKFAWAVVAILGMVSLLFFVIKRKDRKKNATFEDAPTTR